MREIKFRAWDGYRYTTAGIGFNNSTGELVASPKSTAILEQFTGLLDKNGKEIYEGDIVECADYEQIAHAWNRWNRLVEYEAKEARFIGIDGEVNIVIGNIHENPDLLN